NEYYSADIQDVQCCYEQVKPSDQGRGTRDASIVNR
ncbi:unnamed protein product, partial [marine sediment metagenome]